MPRFARHLFGCTVLATAAAHATVLTYIDPASFLAAAGAIRTEAFEGYAADLNPDNGTVLNLGAFTAQGRWTLDTPTLRLDIDGSNNLFLDVSYGGWAALNFAEPITAFGAWFRRVPASIALDASGLQGYGSYQLLTRLTPSASADGTPQFIGFTADQPFNRVVFEGTGCCSGSFALDNVAYAASLTPVPEPSSWALMAAGLLGLLGLSLRARTRLHHTGPMA